MLKAYFFKLATLFYFLLLANFTFAQIAYQVKDIPNPKNNGGDYVSDPDGILGIDALSSLNDTLAKFEHKTSVQVAVVIVNDFDHDKEDFDFAYELFNTWGIGQKSSNNGLLLFIARDRRKYRFITGTGVEGVLPDTKLKHIAEKYLLPAFRENDFSTGIINTINATGKVILNPDNKAELNQLFTEKAEKTWWDKIGIQSVIIIAVYSISIFMLRRKTPKIAKSLNVKTSEYDRVIGFGCGGIILITFILIFLIAFFGSFNGLFYINHIPIYLIIFLSTLVFVNYLGALSSIRKNYFDTENYINAVSRLNQTMWWLMLVSPLVLIYLLRETIRKAKTSKRFKPILDSKNQEMKRINRDENRRGDPYLNNGQQKEEQLNSLLYDIWVGSNNEYKLVANDAEQSAKYEACPGCGFKTYTTPIVKTITTATYTRAGKGKEIQECKNCEFETFIRNIDLPMLVKESSSSSSSGGGSSSSSSSSSSWGGGSSSGGGTGGSW